MTFNKKTTTNLAILVLLGVAVYMGYLLIPEREVGDGSDLNREEAVLIFPEEGASEEVREAHFDLAQSMAQQSDTLDITGCNVDPLVLEVVAGDSVTVVNGDSEPHTLTIEQEYEVAANSEQEVVFDFSYGVGLYGYGCDEGPIGAGIFIVVE